MAQSNGCLTRLISLVVLQQLPILLLLKIFPPLLEIGFMLFIQQISLVV